VVKNRARDAERGKVKLGCVLSVVLLGAILYYGIDYLQVRLKEYQIQDEVNQQATFASVIDDGTILRRLTQKAAELGIPLSDPKRWEIKRMNMPDGRRIVIHAEYTDSVVFELPGIRKVLIFKIEPSATQVYH